MDSAKAYPMNYGNDLHSYATNSTLQRRVIDAVKDFINEGILENLDLPKHGSPPTLRLADMGCSTGPNTFFSVQNIIDAIQKKYELKEITSDLPEFQVFFNDHVTNDFNTLFNYLPPNRQYCAAGVPGSFYGPLFPKASLDIVHSSTSLHWLSQVPKQVVNQASPAWNKGMIFYSGEETVKAYQDQFETDMDCFLHFRAKEVAPEGLMILVFPGRSDQTPHSQVFSNIAFHILGSCLMEMAKKGVIGEEQVDSFNIPMYFCCPKEVETSVRRNGFFSIEKIEAISSGDRSGVKLGLLSSHLRAGSDVLFGNHFGHEIMDELFHSFDRKIENTADFQHAKQVSLFVLLKRKFVN